MQPDDKQSDEEIVEKVNYLTTVLIPSIKAINDAILNGKDPRDATHNLLTDLLFEWKIEISEQVDKETKLLNDILDTQNKLLVKGNSQETKNEAQRKIHNAEKRYSINVKGIIINLIHKKIGLFQTRRKIEHGALSLWELGEGEKEDD